MSKKIQKVAESGGFATVKSDLGNQIAFSKKQTGAFVKEKLKKEGACFHYGIA